MSPPPPLPAALDAEEPSLPAVDDSLADPTLIRALLALTPEERLDRLQAHVDGLWELGLGDAPPLR
ncbi:MAG TPA: hypothetical protein VHM02_00840 [Thermoanaerobaculia bacterium]|nr:hypothetical protein [Thermoanaerobaculia bacterium]